MYKVLATLAAPLGFTRVNPDPLGKILLFIVMLRVSSIFLNLFTARQTTRHPVLEGSGAFRPTY